MRQAGSSGDSIKGKTHMKTVVKTLPACIVFTAMLLTHALAADLLITNARLIDGTGAVPQEGVSILIRDGLISAIGDTAPADGVQVLDAAGATVLPGLIDSHVHLFWGPGGFKFGLTAPATLVDDNGVFDLAAWKSMFGAYTAQYLRAYLACGVTTVLEAASAPDVIAEIRRMLDAGNPGPRYLSLGPGLTTPAGYGDSKKHVTSNSDIATHFEKIDALKTSGVKVFMERGWDFAAKLPVWSAADRDAIATRAAQRGLPIFVHATCEQDQLNAVSMGARALMHPVIMRDAVLSGDAIRTIADTRTYQLTTLMWAGGGELPFFVPSQLKDPLLDLVVPASELADARNPVMRWRAKLMYMKTNVYGQPPLQGLLAKMRFLSKRQCRQWLGISQESLKLEHDAGIKLVVGSDSPYWPTALYSFHGPSTLREIELLGEAGITPMEAIKAATINAAEMLGLDKEIGTVEVGKRAELIIVKDDPLKDLANLRSILWTVQAGVAKTPEQWMRP